MSAFANEMRTMHTPNSPRLLVPVLLCGLATTCSERTFEPNGTCAPDPVVDCSVGGRSAESVFLAGYTCTGKARPDDGSTYVDGVPQGLVCADKGAPGPDGKSAYCCTTFTTQCSYNPVAVCAQEGTYGYQCLGANRPEAVNPAIGCDQGVREDDRIDYCCAGAGIKLNCTQSDAIGCVSGMTGWSCPVGIQPTAQDLGANKSRADLYYLLCPVPTAAPNPKYETYCCYVPALVPLGGTCVQDMAAGCAPGRFGIACYGTDTPEQNFARLRCPDPGVPGKSEQGYPATVYCCDYTRD